MAHSGAIRKDTAGKFYIDGGSSSDGEQEDGYNYKSSNSIISSRLRSRFQLSPKASSAASTTNHQGEYKNYRFYVKSNDQENCQLVSRNFF